MTTLSLDGISKIYGDAGDQVVALADVSLSLERGELLAVVGPSGSGKTTLLAIAGLLLRPTAGRVVLNGREIGDLSDRDMADLRLRHIGFVLQSSNLLPYLTARDQLLLVAELAGRRDRAAGARADQLLEELGLGARTRHYPEALSGGERQRVAIARALMNEPGVILADEPTANLDFQRGHEVVSMLAREVRSRDTAAIMVTHDERMLDLCDRVVRIADGRLSPDMSWAAQETVSAGS
ncbi:MAG TPA: ABC transporter ATP-binding protein [Thermomicrobiales bacterium]|nr:ABC transporter ATP-binding protein [Thermomicrobiales bacterium]